MNIPNTGLPEPVLDRKVAMPALLPDPEAFLIVTSLAGVAKDVMAITREGEYTYSMGGAMGAGVPMGLGLAYAQPDRRVLAVCGDGDLMMSLGILATVGAMQPANLAILCVDNGHYGETGYQAGHTARGVDLAQIAAGAAIGTVRTVNAEADIAPARDALLSAPGPIFVWLRVTTELPPAYKRSWDACERRTVFRRALLGEA